MKNINILLLNKFFNNIFLERIIWIIFFISKGLSGFQIGILQFMITLTQVLFEIPSGIFSDKIGRKKAIILANLFYILYFILFYFNNNFHCLIIGCIMQGIGETLTTGSEEALLYDSLETIQQKDNYSKYLGYFNAINLISLSISSFLGGFISWNLIIFFNILSRVINILFLVFLNDKKINFQKNKKRKLKEYLFINKKIYIFLFISTITIAYISALFIFMPEIFSQLKYSNKYISILYTIIILLNILISLFYVKIKRKISILLIINILLILVSLFFYYNYFIILTFIYSNVIYEVLYIYFLNFLNNNIDSFNRSTSISLYNFFISIFLSMFSLILGTFILIKLSIFLFYLILLLLLVLNLIFILTVKVI